MQENPWSGSLVLGVDYFIRHTKRAILSLRRIVRLVMIILVVLGFGLSIVALGFALHSNVLAILGFQSATSTVYISQFGLDSTWHLGTAFMAIGGLVCFFGLARVIIKYKFICKNFGLGMVTVILDLPLRKRILLLNIPPNWGEVKFQISYRNTDNSFPIDCFWGGGKGLWLFISEPICEELRIWDIDENSNPLRLDNKERLPDNLEGEIRLVKRNKQIIRRYPFTFCNRTVKSERTT